MGKSRSPHTTPSQGDKIQATKCNNTLSGTQTAVIKPYVFHSEHTKMKQNQIRTSPKAVAPTPNKANRTRFRPHNADRNAHRGGKNSGIYNRFAFAIKTLCLLVHLAMAALLASRGSLRSQKGGKGKNGDRLFSILF
jgi:hypothetical protein